MPAYNNSSEINVTIYSITSLETPTSRTIKFGILLAAQLLSICCSLFIFFYFIGKSTFRQALHNHTIIALIIINFLQTNLDLPLVLDYLRRGEASSSIFCLMWNFLAFSFDSVAIWIMTWASFERHILVFRNHLLRTSRSKFFLHYIPLFSCFGIPLIYYIYLVFLYPCTNTFNLTIIFCGYCCYTNNVQLVVFNWLTFVFIPTCLLIIFSSSLIIRIVMQKRHVQQRFSWTRYRFMIIQLFSLACLYMIFAIPLLIIGIIQTIIPTFAVEIQSLYLYYIAYLLPSLVPVFYLISFYKFMTKTQTQIHPLIIVGDTRLKRT